MCKQSQLRLELETSCKQWQEDQYIIILFYQRYEHLPLSQSRPEWEFHGRTRVLPPWICCLWVTLFGWPLNIVNMFDRIMVVYTSLTIHVNVWLIYISPRYTVCRCTVAKLIKCIHNRRQIHNHASVPKCLPNFRKYFRYTHLVNIWHNLHLMCGKFGLFKWFVWKGEISL